MNSMISIRLEVHGLFQASCKEIELAEAHTKEFLAEQIGEAYAGEKVAFLFDSAYWMQYPKSVLTCIYASFVTEEPS